MKIEDLIRTTGEWLKGTGPEGAIVISSRVRLARNLAYYRFPMSLPEEEKREVAGTVREVMERIDAEKAFSFFEVSELSPLDRRLLVERHLISREQEETEGERSVLLCQDETLSIMINEEDHLRLQSLQSGLQLERAYEMLERIDRQLADNLEFAYDDELGYMTACPTNVGTGLRASVMVHLPALTMTRHLEKAFRAIAKLNLAVRGLYGEGTEAHGDFYQISNQVTIGRSEEEILGDLRVVIDQVVSYENSARASLMRKEPAKLEDRVWRSYAILKNARIISSEEVMRHLSSIRLGLHMGILDHFPVPVLNELFICSQPAHLQKRAGRELAASERDIMRATLIRERLAQGETPPPAEDSGEGGGDGKEQG
jgi:protein arginine kinase